MKIELPPPIPAKRDSPKKPPPRSGASPAVKPLPAVSPPPPPPPHPSLLLTSLPAPQPSQKIQSPENEKEGADTARQNLIVQITWRVSHNKNHQPKHADDQAKVLLVLQSLPLLHTEGVTRILVPLLIAGGFVAFVAGLTIVGIKNTSSPATQTQSSNPGSHGSDTTETPAGTTPEAPPSWEDIKAAPEYSQLDPNQRLAVFQHWHDAVLQHASTLEGYSAAIRQEFEGRIANERQALEGAAQWYNEQHSAVQQVQSPVTSFTLVQPTVAPPQTFHVIKVKRGDSLKVRTGPSQTDRVVATLAPGTRGILLLSGRIVNGPTMWQEISVGGYTGWVNEIYLEADLPRAVPRAVKVR